MKWRITARFFIAIIVTILISIISFLVVNIIKIQNNNINPQGITSQIGPNYTLDYGENIHFKNEKVYIEEDKIKELKKNGNWIQVLNENGTEIYNRLKPDNVPTHYTPGKLIFYHKYSGAIKGYTIFVGLANRNDRELSYIIGFPDNKISKYQLIYSPDTFFIDLLKRIIKSLVITIIIALLVGYILSLFLSKPIIEIIKGIEDLSKGRYIKRKKSKGVYKKVYDSLNILSMTLKRNETERLKNEKLREEWITNITHDIKTPLASIKGYSEVLLDSDYNLSNKENKKYIEIIKNKSNYISKLVSDLKLTYEIKNSSIININKKENLVNIIRETIIDILNHPKYQDRLINFYTDMDKINIKCNPLLLKRAFTNLLYNAIIHNPKDTKIKVNIRKEENIIIEIEDNGIGMESKDIENLFKRYYRGTNTGETHKGSGLGMAIAKQIINAHKGKIQVNSKVDEGTKIIIYF
ncbi:MAG: HAMP domain-containing histidine kinase [Firmicutes bacterium]|nr:HAMP domain-containing histidine kinase [Bacillota bacterium]